jgi:hypothetical protein
VKTVKIRQGFVSNSSSSSFILTNTTKKPLRIVDFIAENPQILQRFLRGYGEGKAEGYAQMSINSPEVIPQTQRQMLKDARKLKQMLKPGQNEVVFGDDQGTLIGQVCDYQLRRGGKSKNFEWKLIDAH